MKAFTKLAFIVATTALVPFAAGAHAASTAGSALFAYGTHTIGSAVAADTQTLTVDVTGATSNDYFDTGDPANTIRGYNIGADAHVTGVSFDVNITAVDPSWLSDASVGFTDSAELGGVFLTPGIGDDFPGTASYSDSADLVSLGLDFSVGDDGILQLQYFDVFNDDGVDPDSIWNSGTLTFTYEGGATTPPAVPEPATWAMMIGGFGLVGGAMRRRQAAHATFA